MAAHKTLCAAAAAAVAAAAVDFSLFSFAYVIKGCMSGVCLFLVTLGVVIYICIREA